ncbi:MAG: hypothetical protein KDB90_15775 [Planctomycetes bacterium]|nr:hypothetical protein [Planctomycetota bacterium]
MPDDKPLPKGGADGRTPDLRMNYLGVLPSTDGHSNASMRAMLENACAFLHQVVAITSGVLDTVRAGDLRNLVASEMPAASGHIRLDGVLEKQESDAAEPAPEPSTAQDHRKRPRGQSHPLIGLIKIAMQAARLLRQIAGGLFPGSQNMFSVGQKMQIHTEKSDLIRERLQSKRPYMC